MTEPAAEEVFTMKFSQEDKRATIALLGLGCLGCGALIAWGLGAAIAAVGLWMTSVAICDAIQEAIAQTK